MAKTREKKIWWQAIADEHRKDRAKKGDHTRCSCGACIRARQEGYRPAS